DLNGATRTFAVLGEGLSVTASIGSSNGVAGLVKAGGGDLYLFHNATYTGPTILNEGILQLNNATNSINPASSLTLGGGKLVGSNQTFSGQFTLNPGGSAITGS